MKHLLLTISLFALLTCFVNTANALTIEQQLKPYPELKNYKTKDIVTALESNKPEDIANSKQYCSKKLQSLSGFYFCLYQEENISPYIIVTDLGSKTWRVLQKINNGILIDSSSNISTIIMIEGEFNVFDGQPFSKKHYLLKYDGTFEYTSAIGTTKTVPKLKLLTEIKTN